MRATARTRMCAHLGEVSGRERGVGLCDRRSELGPEARRRQRRRARGDGGLPRLLRRPPNCRGDGGGVCASESGHARQAKGRPEE